MRSSSFLSAFFFAITLLAAALTTTACYRGSKPADVGRVAPAFTLQESGHSVGLDQYRGKIVVLNFWASWCPPCVDELPSLMQMQANLQYKGIVVLGVSVDADAGDYQKFLKDHKVNFVTARDPGHDDAKGVEAKVASEYGTFKFPETYIIDRNGVIRRKLIGAIDWTQPEITEYLTRL